MPEHSEDFVVVEKSVVGGLTANVKRWRGRASAERLQRQRWRKRALAAEAEVERLREALGRIAEWDGSQSGLGYEGPRDTARAALSGSPVEGTR